MTAVVDDLLPDANVKIALVSDLLRNDLSDMVIAVDTVDRTGNLPDKYHGVLSYINKVKDIKDICNFVDLSSLPIEAIAKIAVKKLEQWKPHTSVIAKRDAECVNENGIYYDILCELRVGRFLAVNSYKYSNHLIINSFNSVKYF